jgi:hypothetical protein
VNVLLDANALMIPSQFRVDLFTELTNLIGTYEPFILTEVLHELRGLSRGKGKAGSAARGALLLAERCREVESGYAEGTVDEKIIRYAREHGCMVLTNDRKLRQELLSLEIPVITLKQRKRLDLLRR